VRVIGTDLEGAGSCGALRSSPSIRAAGAVLWRPDPERDGAVQVAVVHRPHHRDWSLPKGKVDPGETRAATAVRELAEETGFSAVLGRHLATVRYLVRGDRKAVDFWDARAGEGAFVPGGETDELRWLSCADAAGLLSYDTDRDVLARFAAAPFPLRTLLLVRHAKAGRRVDWAGPDDERPLLAEGRAQAERIAALLPLHGVTRLHAVPRTRCTATLEPLAARLGAGLPGTAGIVGEPALGDEAVAADPDAARERLLAIATAPGVAAVCAQGDGIPALLRDLAVRAEQGGGRPESNRRLDAPPSRKGSIWTLALHADPEPDGPSALRLVSADYTRDAAR